MEAQVAGATWQDETTGVPQEPKNERRLGNPAAEFKTRGGQHGPTTPSNYQK
jgi:hypothetical protein